MDIQKALLGASLVSGAICTSMRYVKSNNPSLGRIYGVCLAIPDDFTSLSLFVNTESHFASRSGANRWDVYSWWSDGMEIDNEPLRTSIGKVNDIDATPENDNGPAWIAALTIAMAEAKAKGAFETTGIEPYVFCTMTDSSNSHWIQYLTGKYINDSDIFSRLANEVATATYCPNGGPFSSGRQEYRAAFESALAQLHDVKGLSRT